MRNAALVLGILGGLLGMVVGFFGYGWAEFGSWFVEQTGVGADHLGTTEEQEETKLISLVAPILAIAGGSMARSHPSLGAVLLILSTLGMFYGFGFGIFTMFPIAMCGLASLFAVLGILTGRDEEIR